MADPLLVVSGLMTAFRTPDEVVPAVDGVSFTVDRGETLGIVGESGCGKTVTALSIMRLLPTPPAVVSGQVLFEGNDLLTLRDSAMRRIRGNAISMIFQEPMTCLNPVHTIGRQISEAISLHQDLDAKLTRAKAVEMLRLVGIPLPERRYGEFPHRLSGGMRQRVMIAMALSCNPRLLIADEPTTALDVTIQAQILELMKGLKREFGTAIMLITHDLGVIAEMAERVVVMYAGKVAEEAPVGALFANPLHPYTEGLLGSIPRLVGERKRLRAIEGVVPDPARLPGGCRFHPRCPLAQGRCLEMEPPLTDLGGGRRVSCWRYRERLTREVA